MFTLNNIYSVLSAFDFPWTQKKEEIKLVYGKTEVRKE